MNIAYLVNQYPQPSHSFIRREIRAIEAQGIEVRRYTLREAAGALVEPADLDERKATRAVLAIGPVALLGRLVWTFVKRPGPFLQALVLALKLGWRSEKGLIWHLAYLTEACTFLAWVSEWGAEHVHAHFGTNSAMVAMLCRVLGGPTYSFTVHGPEEFDKPQFLGLGEKIARASFTVAVSDFGRSQLCRWSRYKDWARLVVIRCGLGEGFKALRPETAPEARRLVCVARLAEQKGHMVLLEAAARVKTKSLDFRLVLVGDGPMRAEIEKLRDDLGLTDQLELAGWLSEEKVRETIRQSRALLLPSFAEGLPVVLMEAIALGRPVIATLVAGVPELIEDGKSGWLIPAGSIDSLVEAMVAVLTAAPTELSEMARRGAPRVAAMHDSDVEARKLALLFAQAIAAGASGQLAGDLASARDDGGLTGAALERAELAGRVPNGPS